MNCEQAQPELYGFPNVGTPGLAHSLLAWARCRLWCDRQKLPMLAPSWPRIRIGPYLRMERDKRHYNRYFKFDGYVCGLRRSYLIYRSRKVLARFIDLDAIDQLPPGTLVEFKTWERFADSRELFPSILGHSKAIRSALTEMTKPRFRPSPTTEPHIAIHVRMGDFTPPKNIAVLKAGQTNVRIPISWYCDVLRSLRQRLSRDVPVRLYSDGTPSDLAPLLDMPSVHWVVGNPAISDLLAIASSRLLISSGSGFSFWGSYLGQVPRICYSGQRLIRVIEQSPEIELEPECEAGEDIPDAFVSRLVSDLDLQPNQSRTG